MSRRRLALIVFAVVEATGAAMLSAALVGVVYQEWDAARSIALVAAGTVLVGDLGRRMVGRAGELSVREGFAAVGLSWITMTFVGTLPFLVTGAIPNLTDAFFETAAGFTTTGASVVADPATLDHAILFWRALTQWMGGMGIIVLSIAVLPLLGVGGVQLARAESPGHSPDRLTPRFRETAKRLWLLYVGFTAFQAVLLTFSDMNVFEAICHAFSTMSTGGFSTRSESLGAFNEYAQWVAVTFMVIAGASFALHYRALRDAREYPRSAEFRLYALIVAGGALFLVAGRWGHGVTDAVREGVFNAVSVITTTGFVNADFAGWSSALQIAIVGFMFVGGMSGSTAGGVKTYRLAVLTNAGRTDLRRLIHPLGVFRTRMGAKPVDDAVVHSVQTFFLFYMLAFMTGTLLLAMIESGLGVGDDLITSVSAVASSLGNIGPGLSAVGPTETYAHLHDTGKWLLASLMIIGRLEIFPVVLLFTRELWRR